MIDEEEVREIRQSLKELREVVVDIETERGGQTIGSGENRGLLIAMDIVQAKLNALKREQFLKSEIEEKDTIKIRYAYIDLPTTIPTAIAGYGTLRFKVLTIDQLENRSKITLEELITEGKAAVIRILGRDICTGRIDKNGKTIYEGDIIRWYTHDHKHVYTDETVISSTRFYEREPEMDCIVIGTIYDKGDI